MRHRHPRGNAAEYKLAVIIILALLPMASAEYFIDRTKAVGIAGRQQQLEQPEITQEWVVLTPKPVDRIITTYEGDCRVHPASSNPIASKIGDSCWKQIEMITPSGIAIIKDEECERTRPKVMTICTHIGDPVLERATVGGDVYFACLNGHIKLGSGEEQACDGSVHRLDGRATFGNESFEKPNNSQDAISKPIAMTLLLILFTMAVLAITIAYQCATIADLRKKLRTATTREAIQLVNFGFPRNDMIDPDSETINLIDDGDDSLDVELVEPEQQPQQNLARPPQREVSIRAAEAAQRRIGAAINENVQRASREAEANIMDRPVACNIEIDVVRPDTQVNLEEPGQRGIEGTDAPPMQASTSQTARKDEYRTKSGRVCKKTKAFGF